MIKETVKCGDKVGQVKKESGPMWYHKHSASF